MAYSKLIQYSISCCFFAEVAQWQRKSSEIELARARVDYIIFCAVPRPWTAGPGLLSRNLKPRKLILRAFSDFSRKLAPPKITRYAVYYRLASSPGQGERAWYTLFVHAPLP
jgi:hypothetical protein